MTKKDNKVYSAPFVNGQEPELFHGQHNGVTPNLPYGLGNTAKNGCGWIALYNALLLAGSYMKPVDVILEIIARRGLRLWGFFGTKSRAIARIIRERGHKVNRRIFVKKSINFDAIVRSSVTVILEYAWLFGGHYVTLRYDPDGKAGDYVVYSDTKDAVAGQRYLSINKWVKSKMLILSVISVES